MIFHLHPYPPPSPPRLRLPHDRPLPPPPPKPRIPRLSIRAPRAPSAIQASRGMHNTFAPRTIAPGNRGHISPRSSIARAGSFMLLARRSRFIPALVRVLRPDIVASARTQVAHVRAVRRLLSNLLTVMTSPVPVDNQYTRRLPRPLRPQPGLLHQPLRRYRRPHPFRHLLRLLP